MAALEALDAHRLLCAHRRGPRGVAHWSALAARWIADEHPVLPRADGRYAGEPLLVTANDYEIGLYNGDTGVVVDDGRGGLVAAFGRGGEPIVVPLVRLGAVRPLHAMTVHRSQGSQFARITVLLPAAGSPLGTRRDALHRGHPRDVARAASSARPRRSSRRWPDPPRVPPACASACPAPSPDPLVCDMNPRHAGGRLGVSGTQVANDLPWADPSGVSARRRRPARSG